MGQIFICRENKCNEFCQLILQKSYVFWTVQRTVCPCCFACLKWGGHLSVEVRHAKMKAWLPTIWWLSADYLLSSLNKWKQRKKEDNSSYNAIGSSCSHSKMSLYKQSGIYMVVVMTVLPTHSGTYTTAGSKLGLWKATLGTRSCLPGPGLSADTGSRYGSCQPYLKASNLISQVGLDFHYVYK